MTDRLRTVEVFIAVAEAGSLAAAARRLAMSPPAVTRAVAALEDRLGTRLLNRTTRRLHLTEAGQRFLEEAGRALALLGEAEQTVAGATVVPTGRLTITASVTFGRLHLVPAVTAFLRRYPDVSASVLLVDRVVNLVEEGLDVAVRIGHLPDSTLVARKFGEVRRVLVASPDYLVRRGTPAVPRDLAGHAILGFSGLLPTREWRLRENGQTVAVPVTPRLEVNDALSAIDAALAGNGITVALSYMVAEAVATKRLVLVLERFAPPPMPVQLVHPAGRAVAAKVRAFVDFAAPRLAAVLTEVSHVMAAPGARNG